MMHLKRNCSLILIIIISFILISVNSLAASKEENPWTRVGANLDESKQIQTNNLIKSEKNNLPKQQINYSAGMEMPSPEDFLSEMEVTTEKYQIRTQARREQLSRYAPQLNVPSSFPFPEVLNSAQSMDSNTLSSTNFSSSDLGVVDSDSRTDLPMGSTYESIIVQKNENNAILPKESKSFNNTSQNISRIPAQSLDSQSSEPRSVSYVSNRGKKQTASKTYSLKGYALMPGVGIHASSTLVAAITIEDDRIIREGDFSLVLSNYAPSNISIDFPAAVNIVGEKSGKIATIPMEKPWFPVLTGPRSLSLCSARGTAISIPSDESVWIEISPSLYPSDNTGGVGVNYSTERFDIPESLSE